jgi:hypothetical protein
MTSLTGGMNLSRGLDTTSAFQQPAKSHRIAPLRRVTVLTVPPPGIALYEAVLQLLRMCFPDARVPG